MAVQKIKIGDFVRVRGAVEEPRFNWGNVTPESIGQVASIHPFHGYLVVDFPEHEGWKGVEEELEIVKAYPSPAVNERDVNHRDRDD